MKTTGILALAVLAGVLGSSAGCGGANVNVKIGGKGGAVSPTAAVEKKALERFNQALDAFNGHD
ncbi:MAG: hypothetical protein ACRELB_05230, partial [Polyangiaceae bacterium]